MVRYIPSSIDLDGMIQEHPPEFQPFKRDKLVQLLHLFNEVPSLNDDWQDSAGYVTLNAQKLQRWCQNYTSYIGYLVDRGIIEVDRHYQVGQQSMGYRLTDPYNTPVVPIEISDFILVRRLRSWVGIHSQSAGKYPYLVKYFNPKLMIDYTAALDYLQANRELTITQRNGGIMNIHKLFNQEFRFKVDDTGHRLHTNFTMLRRDLRRFITYDHTPLVGVDLRNAQPFMLGRLLDPSFWLRNNINDDRFNYYRSFPDLAKTGFLSPRILDEVMSETSNPWSYQNRSLNDVGEYIQQVSTASLYSEIQHYAEDVMESKPSSSDEAKRQVFLVFYAPNRTFTKYKGVFMRLYPTVYGEMQSLKQDDHKKLAVLLQRIESSFMLDKVARRIAKEQPKMPLFTIHDSIVCPVGMEGLVKSVIESEGEQWFGMIPPVKYEPMTAP